VPIFTLVIAIPALFLTYGQPLVHIFGKIIITRQGRFQPVSYYSV